MKTIMEKEPESLAVQMKADYASSEVYSTAGSEAPPAYKTRTANSVKIAKIIAGTIILSSFILGFFILASTYLQSRAVCDQIQTLENALDKEMVLEFLSQQQDLPRTAALQGSSQDESNMIDVEEKKPSRKDNNVENTQEANAESNFSDNDESQDMNRFQFKLPLDIDLNELASSFIRNSEKTKMNCVVERRRAEELVDAPAKQMSLPFGMNIMTETKKQRVTGERIAIVCESNTEPREEERNEPEIHVRQFIVPIQRPAQLPIPYGQMPNPQMGPITHMPMRMESAPAMNQVQGGPGPMMPPQMGVPPFIRQLIAQAQAAQAAQQRPPVPQQMMQAPPVQEPQIRIFRMGNPDAEMQSQPQPQPQIRIQLHRIAMPNPMRIPEQAIDNSDEQAQQPQRLQVQAMPLSEALQRAGISPEDLDNIRKIAEEKFQQEVSRFMEADDELSQSDESDDEAPMRAQEQIGMQAPKQVEQMPEQQMPPQQQQMQQQSQEQQSPEILPMGRSGFARSLLKPVSIPVQMMPKMSEEESTEAKNIESALSQ